MALPQSRALLWRRVDGTTQVLSGADLHARAGELAAALHALGVRRGDRVAGLLGRRPEAFALPLATWRLGAIYVPLFSGFGTEALRVRLADSGTRVLVVDEANAPAAASARTVLGELLVASVEAAGSTRMTGASSATS
jgi:acetyl-CoA synthetase